MSRSLVLHLTSLLVILLFLNNSTTTYSVSAKATRDWTKNPAVIEIDTTEDVYAISDAHADFKRVTAVLLAAKLIAKVPSKASDVEWSAGKSVLIVIGDMVDKWKHSVQVVKLMMALQKSAAAQGGQVIVTMGNHEAEFLANPTGKKTSEFSQNLVKEGLKPKKVADCKGDIGEFLCGLPMAVRVNDWFFCHAGNTNKMSIQQLSTSIMDGFASTGFDTPALIGGNSLLEARLNSKGLNGLPWIYDGIKTTNPATFLTSLITALGVKHIVQGHQPGSVKFLDGQARAKNNLFQRYGLLFLIDTGMSRGVDGKTSSGGVIRITGSGNESVIALCGNGTSTTLWDNLTNPPMTSIHCGF